MSPPPRDALAFSFFNEVAIIEQLSRNAFERVLPEGLSLAGFTVLNHMLRLGHERRPPAKIASAVQVTRGAMTGTLKRLETAGFIVIAPDPADGRGKMVSVTSAGRAAHAAAVAALGPLFDDVLTKIDLAALEGALPTLMQVRRILDAARD